MKRNLVMGGLCALVLAGCGLVPPVSIGEDPFALNGKESTPVALRAAGALQTQIIAVGKADATATFADITQSIPVNPSSLEIKLNINELKLTNCPNIPPTINVKMNAKLTVSDNGGTAPTTARSSEATANNLSFDYNTATKAVSNFNTGTLTFSASQVLAIIQTGGTNTVTLSADVTTDSTPGLAGCSLSIVWGKGAGSVKF